MKSEANNKGELSFYIRAKNVFKKLVEKKREDAVYFVSFPKSGRTWLRLMIAKVYSELTGLDVELFLNSDKSLLNNSAQPYAYLKFSHGYQNSVISQGGSFPADYYKGKKVVLMIRDPRDVVVSHYYHEKYHYKSFSGSIGEFIRYRYDETQEDPGKRKARFGIVPIIRYMNAWQCNQGDLEGFFLLTYEDMKQDTLKYLFSVCNYLELPVKKELLEEVIEDCSFRNMRKLEENNEMDWKALDSSGNKKAYKTRKGKAGGYVEELSDEDIAFIEDEIIEKLDPEYSRYIFRTKKNVDSIES